MRLEDFALDETRGGQVAVKVKFAAINPIDWKLRNGLMKIITGNAFPRAMGMDLSTRRASSPASMGVVDRAAE